MRSLATIARGDRIFGEIAALLDRTGQKFPTWTALAELLNQSGIASPTGRRWSGDNLRHFVRNYRDRGSVDLTGYVIWKRNGPHANRNRAKPTDFQAESRAG